MTYTQIIILIGILLVILPFIGIALVWKYSIIVLSGLVLLLLSYIRNSKRKFHKVYSTKTFSQSIIEPNNLEENNDEQH